MIIEGCNPRDYFFQYNHACALKGAHASFYEPKKFLVFGGKAFWQIIVNLENVAATKTGSSRQFQ